MTNETFERCINIDWLELYVLESNDRYPCNAQYFQRHGYLVRERPYGTRVYKEMFEILDSNNQPIIEIRRNPASGDSEFNGLLPQSCHIRLPNWVLYQDSPIRFLSEFLVLHDYIFKRIFRIDIALDFVRFDSGDVPARFVKRYLEGKFRKVNQARITSHGDDNWNDFNWNSLSWGSPTSMVSTKLYNKSRELMESKTDKPYIRTAWMMQGLVDNPTSLTKRDTDGVLRKVDVWRLEYSMKSACDGWVVIEMQGGKKMKKQHIPHRLSMFDGKDKLWQRFQDLTYHYFRFKYREYKDDSKSLVATALSEVHSDGERELKRKDRCRDKKLFYFDAKHVFHQVQQAPSNSKTPQRDNTLERLLRQYRDSHANVEIRNACEVILKEIDLNKLVNYSPKHDWREARALQLTIARKMDGDTRKVATILDEILNLINEGGIF